MHNSSPMQCMKNSCNVWIMQRNEWAHGDAFEASGVLLLRLNTATRERPFNQLHYTIHDYSIWLDQDRPGPSMMISHSWDDHGYDGIPLALQVTKETS